MFRALVENYIEELTEDDVITFASNDNVTVTEEEANLFIKTVKENKDDIFAGNGQKHIDSLKGKVSNEAFEELELLWNKYKKFIG